MRNKDAENHAIAEYEQFAKRRREYKEELGELENIRMLENVASELISGNKAKKLNKSRRIPSEKTR